MTNTVLLKEKIAKKGLKMGYVAQYIGLSRMGLYNKVNNRRPFNQFEIERLCDVLQITSWKEKEALFFAKDVDINVYTGQGVKQRVE